MTIPPIAEMAGSLLDWYERHARKLPWRISPQQRSRGVRPDPYRVWLSEVMLQQTTVAAVKTYYETFVERWPDVLALATAPREDVMKAWAGLGYYARARNLKACAEKIAGELGGEFPQRAAELRALPGIGEYTAAAIAAIAFDEPAPVVDGNIERVIARIFAIETPLPAAKAIIRARQAELTPKMRAGDYAQALMDLGATICTPKRPACSLCPWSAACAAYSAGTPEGFPIRLAKPERPTRYGTAYVAIREDGAILLRKRGERRLLGGMSEVPGTDWTGKTVEMEARAPFPANWRALSSPVIHVFTHFRLELQVFAADVRMNCVAPGDAWWAAAEAVPNEALPSVFKKTIEAAAPGATKR
jgi:A/G-specific adenine glycosylase